MGDQQGPGVKEQVFAPHLKMLRLISEDDSDREKPLRAGDDRVHGAQPVDISSELQTLLTQSRAAQGDQYMVEVQNWGRVVAMMMTMRRRRRSNLNGH